MKIPSSTANLIFGILLVMGTMDQDSWTAMAFSPPMSSSNDWKTHQHRSNRLPSSISSFSVPTTSRSTCSSVVCLKAETAESSSSAGSTSRMTGTAVLYGHPGTRSPLVNWAAEEVGFPLTMAADLQQNPHPFGQLPCLMVKMEDGEEDVVVFESGAILQYIHSMTNADQSPAQRAAISSWITWANASLDPICFLETPDGKVYDTGLKRPQKRMDQLEAILSKSKYLTSDKEFTVADVAVASYLLYVIQFFPDTVSYMSGKWPKIKQYMKDGAARPAYGAAFGKRVQDFLIAQLSADEDPSSKKKIFGMF